MSDKKSKHRDSLKPLRKGVAWASKYISKITSDARDKAQEVDEELGVTERVKSAGGTLKRVAKTQGLDTAGKNLAKAAVGAVKFGIDVAKKGAAEVEAKTGVSDHVGSLVETITEKVGEPTSKLIVRSGLPEKTDSILNKMLSEYGELRAGAKAYSLPATVEDQLINTRKELVKITACILQVPAVEAENWLGKFGKLVTAKTSGIIASGSILGLVSAFGTAGTGTAIASLSGAASSSATLAWVGGWVGGGMAAGALLTAGVGVLAGVVIYKLLGSEARQYEELDPVDKSIVESVGMLVAAIDDSLAHQPVRLSKGEAEGLLSEALTPLYNQLVENSEDVCSRLDNQHKALYREHILWDYGPVILDGFEHLKGALSFSAEAIIGGVIYALLTHTALDGSPEQQAVMTAIRRSTNSLEDASESEVADYLAGMLPEQIQGFASNVKGISHELLFVERYNLENTDTIAKIMDQTNHLGYDVELVDAETGEVLRRIQLKATDNKHAVDEHNELYPEIEVMATEELAKLLDHVEGSGFTNADLARNTDEVLSNVVDNTVSDRAFESAEVVGLVAAGREAIAVLQGQAEVADATKKTLAAATQAAAATGITAFLFG